MSKMKEPDYALQICINRRSEIVIAGQQQQSGVSLQLRTFQSGVMQLAHTIVLDDDVPVIHRPSVERLLSLDDHLYETLRQVSQNPSAYTWQPRRKAEELHGQNVSIMEFLRQKMQGILLSVDPNDGEIEHSLCMKAEHILLRLDALEKFL